VAAPLPHHAGMRVRTGRFEKLRLAETGDTEAIEVGDSQDALNRAVAIAPPRATVSRHLAGNLGASTQRAQFAVHRRTAFPMLELKRSQPMAQPLDAASFC